MPLISIKYSNNVMGVDFKSLCQTIHSLLVKHCDARLESCKSMIQRFDTYMIGDGNDDKQGFVLIKVGISPGRSENKKELLLKSLIKETNCKIEQMLSDNTLKVQTRFQLYDLENYYFG